MKTASTMNKKIINSSNKNSTKWASKIEKSFKMPYMKIILQNIKKKIQSSLNTCGKFKARQLLK